MPIFVRNSQRYCLFVVFITLSDVKDFCLAIAVAPVSGGARRREVEHLPYLFQVNIFMNLYERFDEIRRRRCWIQAGALIGRPVGLMRLTCLRSQRPIARFAPALRRDRQAYQQADEQSAAPPADGKLSGSG